MGYILVNPKISNRTIKSDKKDSTEAAEHIWSELSENVKNYTPKFYFTIQEGGNSKLHHYVVKENIENQRVQFNLKKFNGKKGKKIDDKSLLDKLKQEGGKHHRHSHRDNDSSSSSSSSSSSEMVFTFPSGKHKNTSSVLTYYPSIYGVPNIILPSFVSTFATFTNIGILPSTVIVY